MRKILTVILVSLLCVSMFSILAPQVKAEEGSWTTKTSLPQHQALFGAAVVNGKIYAIGGQYQGADSVPAWSDANYEYDPVSDSWNSKAFMPTKRTTLTAVSVNDKIYAIGGAASTSGGAYSTNEEYDPVSNSWTVKAPMPTPRNWISGAVAYDKVYVIGGSDNSGGIFSINEAYDPITDTWTTKNPDPQDRLAYGIGAVNNKIYVIGGWVRPGPPPGEPTTLNEEYDPQTDTWTTKAPMPTARNGLAVAVVNDKIYAIGGATDFNPWTNNLNVVEEYDPATDSWRTVQPMPTPRSLLSAVAITNQIYAIGGWGSTGYLNTNEESNSLACPPVGYWKFDEGSGSIAQDSSGNGNDGTINGAGWTAGITNGALQFDGVNDYVGIADSPSLRLTSNQASLELWFKPTVTLDSTLTRRINILDKGDGYGFQMEPGARIFFTVWIGGNQWLGTVTSNWIAGKWYHIAGTYDGTTEKVYVNGILENSQSISGSLSGNSLPLSIGSYCYGTMNFFPGTIDEVKIYNYGRTAEEIQNDYASGAIPDFDFSASPTTIVLYAGELNKQASLTLRSVNGYSGSIQLGYSDSPQGSSEGRIRIDIPTSISLGVGDTYSPHIWFSSIFDNGRFAALGEYNFAISANDGSTKHDLTIMVKLVANTIAIKNLVHLQQIPTKNAQFSVQQNFLIAAPNGTVVYWAQNVVVVRPKPLFASGSRIWSTFQIWKKPDWKSAVEGFTWSQSMWAMFTDSRIVSFPIDLTLTSYIDGNDLVMTNDASSRLNTGRLTLPAGSYIVGYTGKYEYQDNEGSWHTWNADHQSPEIAIVSMGGPLARLLGSGDFTANTKGSVECFVKLFGESTWSLPNTSIMYTNSNQPQTLERSAHLAWNPDNTFKYSQEMVYPDLGWAQGVSFSPNYP